MLDQNEKQRYERQLRLPEWGESGQLALKNAKILVVGLGGLGCPVSMYLTSSGIGQITLVDGDTISLSNLPRQVLYSSKDIGQYKVNVAAQRLLDLNPTVKVKPIPEYLNKDLALELVKGMDLVVDCSDNQGTRYLINDVCSFYTIPFVSAGVFKFEGQVGIYNVKLPNGQRSSSYRDVFPQETNTASGINCNEVGAVSTAVGLLGLYQSNEVIKYFVSRDSVLINSILCINLLQLSHTTLKVQPKFNPVGLDFILATKYDLPFCHTETGASNLKKYSMESFLFLDVREEGELPVFTHAQLRNIPFSELPKKMENLADQHNIVVLCQSGVRSAKARQLILNAYPSYQVFSYENGIERFFEEMIL